MAWDGADEPDGFDILDNAEVEEEEEVREEEDDINLQGRPRRGEDVPWKLTESYANMAEFKASEVYQDLNMFTVKNTWKAGGAKAQALTCKFSRKSNYKKCPKMLKVEYSSTDQRVRVFDNQCEHHHEVDMTNIRGTGKKYIWTPQQEAIMLPLVKARASAKVILRELQTQAATDRHGAFPTLLQLNTKKNYMFKTQVMEELILCDTADLRILIEERSAVPEDPHQPFVCAYKIDDSDPHGKPRFTVTFSTPHMLSLINRFGF